MVKKDLVHYFEDNHQRQWVYNNITRQEMIQSDYDKQVDKAKAYDDDAAQFSLSFMAAFDKRAKDMWKLEAMGVYAYIPKKISNRRRAYYQGRIDKAFYKLLNVEYPEFKAEIGILPSDIAADIQEYIGINYQRFLCDSTIWCGRISWTPDTTSCEEEYEDAD